MNNRINRKMNTFSLCFLIAIIMTTVFAFAQGGEGSSAQAVSSYADPTVYLVAGVDNEPAADYIKGLVSYPARTTISFVFDNITDYDVIELTLTYSEYTLSFDVPYSYSPWAVNFPAADLSQPGVVKYSLRSGQEDDLAGKTGAADLISVNVLCAGDPCLRLSGVVKYKNGDTVELKAVIGADGADPYAPSNGKVEVNDAPLFIGVWRGKGDLTGNVTETGKWLHDSILKSSDIDISLEKSEIIKIGLPDDSYILADSKDAVITLKEDYLRERNNGYNYFRIYFNDITVDIKYFVMKEKTEGDFRFKTCPGSRGQINLFLRGIPATDPSLLSGVKLDGKDTDPADGIRVTSSFHTVVFSVSPEAVPRDTQTHVYTLTFENIGSVTVTVYPCRLGDVDGNAKIDSKDARLALRASAKLESLPDAAFVAADIDSDDNISASEARTILRVGAKLESI